MRPALLLAIAFVISALPSLAEAQQRPTEQRRRYVSPPRYNPPRYYVEPRRHYVPLRRYYAAPRRYYYYEAQPRDDRAGAVVAVEPPRHTGLLVRGVLGAGGISADDDLNDSTLSGGAGMFSFDLGAGVARGLALHGRFAVSSMFEPNVSQEGRFQGSLEDTSLTFALLGLGATYYFPSNFYVTGVAGLSTASFEFYGDEYDTLSGLGIHGDVGYEWPLGSDLGIGIAGRLEMHSVRDEAGRLSTGALGVLVSLTYF